MYMMLYDEYIVCSKVVFQNMEFKYVTPEEHVYARLLGMHHTLPSLTSEPNESQNVLNSHPKGFGSLDDGKNNLELPKVKKPGNIITVSSTMFGGKSVYALHVMESRSKAYRRIYGSKNVVLYINHSLDDRTDGPFSTHSDIISSEALDKINVNYMKASTLAVVSDERLSQHKVVFIDEAQFFPDLVQRVLYMSEVLGIDVYAMGLTLDYKRQIFGQLGYLSLLSNESIVLRSTFCGFCAAKGEMEKAIYTHRINDISGAQVQTGSDDYIPLCRECYVKHNPISYVCEEEL